MSLLHDAAVREFVIQQLTSIGGIHKGDEILLVCCFHNDSNPSLRVHVGHKIFPGSYHCFACKASGNWNSLARKLNLPILQFGSGSSLPTDKSDIAKKLIENPFAVLSNELSRSPVLTTTEPQVFHGHEPLPRNFSWRGYGRAFYEHLGGRYVWDKKTSNDFLYFPLNMSGVYKGYTLCALTPGFEPKYQTLAPTHEIFFLYDCVPNDSNIFLVEGHFDALRMHAEGFNALGIFGTSNWSQQKKARLLAKNPRNVFILMDGDDAGYRAAQEIFTDLRSGTIPKIVYLPNDGNKTDPGNMNQEWVDYCHLLNKL